MYLRFTLETARKIRQLTRKRSGLITDLRATGFQLTPAEKDPFENFDIRIFGALSFQVEKMAMTRFLTKRFRWQFGSRGEQMKTEDRYLKFARWSEEDKAYVGYGPDLFPWGGVCQGDDEEQTYRELRQLVMEEIQQLIAEGKELPLPITRPMREPAGV